MRWEREQISLLDFSFFASPLILDPKKGRGRREHDDDTEREIGKKQYRVSPAIPLVLSSLTTERCGHTGIFLLFWGFCGQGSKTKKKELRFLLPT